jgi:hypothetical protein
MEGLFMGLLLMLGAGVGIGGIVLLLTILSSIDHED